MQQTDRVIIENVSPPAPCARHVFASWGDARAGEGEGRKVRSAFFTAADLSPLRSSTFDEIEEPQPLWLTASRASSTHAPSAPANPLPLVYRKMLSIAAMCVTPQGSRACIVQSAVQAHARAYAKVPPLLSTHKHRNTARAFTSGSLSNTAEVSSTNLRAGAAFDNLKASWNQVCSCPDATRRSN